MEWIECEIGQTCGCLSRHYYKYTHGTMCLSVESYGDDRYGVWLTSGIDTLYKNVIMADSLQKAQQKAAEFMDTCLTAAAAAGMKYINELVMTRPYTARELEAKMDEKCFVTGYVAVPLNDMINAEFEEFLDLLSVKLTGGELLMEISYQAVSILNTDADNNVVIKVHGNVSEILSEEKEEDTGNMKVCPKCGCQEFHVTQHVTQTVKVDGEGHFIKELTSCDEITHAADDDDIWTCAGCGYDAAGSEFNRSDEKEE